MRGTEPTDTQTPLYTSLHKASPFPTAISDSTKFISENRCAKAHLGFVILFAHVERSQRDHVDDQGRRGGLDGPSRPMNDLKDRQESSKEQLETFVQKSRRKGRSRGGKVKGLLPALI
jgi:hypothetical protein